MPELTSSYRPNPTYSENNYSVPRLWATIDLQRYGVRETVSALPIYHRRLSGGGRATEDGDLFHTTLAGLPLASSSLDNLEKTMDRYLGVLAYYGHFPAYVLQVGDRAWPLYEFGDQIVARFGGRYKDLGTAGAPTIGALRRELADAFKSMGQIKNRKELSVLSLSRSDLQLLPPLSVFRATGIDDIPVFPVAAEQGLRLVAPLPGGGLAVGLRDATSLLRLHGTVSTYLQHRGKIGAPAELTIRKLSAVNWQRLEARLKATDEALSYEHAESGEERHVPIYGLRDQLVAARRNRLNRVTLYVAPSRNAIRQQLHFDLQQEGKR